jgi:hypothetical protein
MLTGEWLYSIDSIVTRSLVSGLAISGATLIYKNLRIMSRMGGAKCFLFI